MNEHGLIDDQGFDELLNALLVDVPDDEGDETTSTHEFFDFIAAFFSVR